MTVLEVTAARVPTTRYVSGTYPESPSHILEGITMHALCGSRISLYKHASAEPQRRLCTKCAKKAGLEEV
ncbi:MAG: hypothetical protein JO165_11580 [Candidatus Eremiobacteraeota bacterium]|nr:hypothetical protein [Candidatus Eremiobacteraeota bacterium]